MSSQFFKYPANYLYGRQAFSVDSSDVRTGAPQINDNDYRTFSTEKRFILQMHGATTATNTQTTHVYLIGQNITNYTISVPTGQGRGTGVTNQTIPSSAVVNGRQYGFAQCILNAREAEVTLTGTNTRLYEIMLIDIDVSLPRLYQVMNVSKTDRGSTTRRNIRGQLVKVPGVEGRPKWNYELQGIFHGDNDTVADTLLNFFDVNPNFTFAPNISEWPDRLYPALLNGGVSIAYVGRLFNQRQLNFTIVES